MAQFINLPTHLIINVLWNTLKENKVYSFEQF